MVFDGGVAEELVGQCIEAIVVNFQFKFLVESGQPFRQDLLERSIDRRFLLFSVIEGSGSGN